MPDHEKRELIASMKEEIVLTLKAMQPEMEAGLEKKVESTVNGKINAIRVVLDDHVITTNDHRKKVDEFIELMAPAVEGIRLAASLRKLAVWFSGFGILGTIAWLGFKGLLGR